MAKEDLFYSESEKILFWVVGYSCVDNTQKIDDTIKGLQDLKQKFIELGGSGDIKSFMVEKSRRYKYNRVVFCENINNPPENAFNITNKNGWTMHKWLND